MVLALLLLLQTLSVRVTPPYDKCECFPHCFPLILVNHERKGLIGEKLHVGVDIQPIPSV